MAEDHYVLQALLYQVALHRYLRWRVRDYLPERHLGGIAYLFVRGLVGPDTPIGDSGEPYGLFTWNPPLPLIIALDEELSQ
jgi:exodeoxyribonuclease V beta subunit